MAQSHQPTSSSPFGKGSISERIYFDIVAIGTLLPSCIQSSNKDQIIVGSIILSRCSSISHKYESQTNQHEKLNSQAPQSRANQLLLQTWRKVYWVDLHKCQEKLIKLHPCPPPSYLQIDLIQEGEGKLITLNKGLLDQFLEGILVWNTLRIQDIHDSWYQPMKCISNVYVVIFSLYSNFILHIHIQKAL